MTGPTSPGAEPDTPILKISGVSKVYGGEVALEDVSLTIAAGTVHGLIGANGAGKSTLVQIVSGVTAHDGGWLELDGERLASPYGVADARRHGIAYIDQDRALFADLSIAENISLTVGHPRRHSMVDSAAMREQADSAMAEVGIDHDPETPVGELPVSDQTMIAVARALATDAKLILLDEPTSNLGAAEATWLMNKLRALVARGVSCVLITHALGEALSTCDTITVLRDGKVADNVSSTGVDERALTELMLGHAQGELEAAGRTESRVRFAVAGASAKPRLRLDTARCDRLGPLSLQVRPGEIVALTGHADSGHLVAGDALSGMRRLSEGSIYLDGEPFAPTSVSDAMAEGVACVPPDRVAEGLASEMSSRENLFLDGSAVARFLQGISVSRERRKSRSILVESSVKPADPEAVVSTLSGGNQQKVLIAKWLSTKPRALVLCEPTVGIDIGAREEIYAQLRAACEQGLAILLASSDFEEVQLLADRTLVLRYGTVVAELSRDEISIAALNALSGGTPGPDSTGPDSTGKSPRH